MIYNPIWLTQNYFEGYLPGPSKGQPLINDKSEKRTNLEKITSTFLSFIKPK